MKTRRLAFLMGLALSATVIAGCGGSTSPSAEAPPPANAPVSAPGGESSRGAGDARLAELEAKLKASPDDAALKTETAQATYEVGHAMMINPDLPPREKYRGALRHYRRVLELNPEHAEAKAEKKQIEDIYQSMGRPIPE